MKGSEAILRAIASEGGRIPATKLDEWVSKLVASEFLEKEVRDDEDVFHYRLTAKSVNFLRGKGVKI